MTQQHLHALRDVLTDGAYRKGKFVHGGCRLPLQQIGQLRGDANLRHLSTGPRRPGPGRPKTSDGKVDWAALARFEQIETNAAGIVLSAQGVNPGPGKRNLRVVKVVEPHSKRWALLFSTDVALPAETI